MGALVRASIRYTNPGERRHSHRYSQPTVLWLTARWIEQTWDDIEAKGGAVIYATIHPHRKD